MTNGSSGELLGLPERAMVGDEASILAGNQYVLKNSAVPQPQMKQWRDSKVEKDSTICCIIIILYVSLLTRALDVRHPVWRGVACT
jgi:hypothetical protein